MVVMGVAPHTSGQKFFTTTHVPRRPKPAAVFAVVVYMIVSQLPPCTAVV